VLLARPHHADSHQLESLGLEPLNDLANKASLDAVNGDTVASKQVLDVVAGLEDAAAKLRKCAAEADVEGITGKAEFLRLAEGYEARAKVYRQAAALLDEGAKVSAPEVSPIEKDAMTFMTGRGYMQRAKSKTRESIDAAKQRSRYSGSSKAPEEAAGASSGTEPCSALQLRRAVRGGC